MARKVLDNNGVLYLWNKIKAKFVAQEDGKGLSANDYTDAEKTKLAGIEEHANYYKHPTGAGYSHIPVGGSSGQILRWSAAGTATWGADKDTTYTAATTTTDGLMSAADKTKLNGITTGANKYTHPTYTAHTSGLYKITVNNTGHVSAATAVGKDDITALGIPAQDTTYTAASQVKMGLLTAADKTKLDGIANGAEVNQNAFSTVQVGNSGEFTFSATSKEDKLTITAGTGITITMDREKRSSPSMPTPTATRKRWTPSPLISGRSSPPRATPIATRPYWTPPRLRLPRRCSPSSTALQPAQTRPP